MLFNSVEFALFLPLVYLLYWLPFRNNLRHQNLLILLASYVFYGWWDYRFLSLIFISSIADYYIGLKLGNTDKIKKRKLWLYLSLSVNLGLLGFFKYYNFFIESFIRTISMFGLQTHSSSIAIILPVGISFYTFQTLSYSIDIYRSKLNPTKDVVQFLAFVSFFPQLVAGPIERANKLLPQFNYPRSFNLSSAKDGLRQILWGLLKKIVIADTCARNADIIFNNPDIFNGSALLLGAIYFAFQIYGDFSGYSDIAIGTAKLFGFDLMRNFAYPYFSRDIAEFWRRWHISLSSWFRDYVYIPLGGSYGNKMSRIRNIIITFTISGFWHGANFTYILWGFLNGLYYIPLMLVNKQKRNTDLVAENTIFPNPLEVVQIGTTFCLTLVAWVIFRSQSISSAFLYLKKMFSISLFEYPKMNGLIEYTELFLIALFVIVEWIQRKKSHGLKIESKPILFRWSVYLVASLAILFFWGYEQEFIYFQF